MLKVTGLTYDQATVCYVIAARPNVRNVTVTATTVAFTDPTAAADFLVALQGYHGTAAASVRRKVGKLFA